MSKCVCFVHLTCEKMSKFGSMKQAKQIILGHWEQCARADNKKRVNVGGVRQQMFEYPFLTRDLKQSAISLRSHFHFLGDNRFSHHVT